MIYNSNKREIILNKEINKLDKFVLDFVSLLDDYVIVSGYVSILLGRSRATEDVDLLIPNLSKEEFFKLWDRIKDSGFQCLNSTIKEECYEMLKDHAIRFSKNRPIQNIEFKMIKNDLDKYSFEKKIKVVLKKGLLFISPLELQIAYKLFLGSEKDIEDAKHIYVLFNDKINKEELLYFSTKLKVQGKMELLK